eukprot:3803387-Rhodomonas_salina.1
MVASSGTSEPETHWQVRGSFRSTMSCRCESSEGSFTDSLSSCSVRSRAGSGVAVSAARFWLLVSGSALSKDAEGDGGAGAGGEASSRGFDRVSVRGCVGGVEKASSSSSPSDTSAGGV